MVSCGGCGVERGVNERGVNEKIEKIRENENMEEYVIEVPYSWFRMNFQLSRVRAMIL
jgi:hypothetical protein